MRMAGQVVEVGFVQCNAHFGQRLPASKNRRFVIGDFPGDGVSLALFPPGRVYADAPASGRIVTCGGNAKLDIPPRRQLGEFPGIVAGIFIVPGVVPD